MFSRYTLKLILIFLISFFFHNSIETRIIETNDEENLTGEDFTTDADVRVNERFNQLVENAHAMIARMEVTGFEIKKRDFFLNALFFATIIPMHSSILYKQCKKHETIFIDSLLEDIVKKRAFIKKIRDEKKMHKLSAYIQKQASFKNQIYTSYSIKSYFKFFVSKQIFSVMFHVLQNAFRARAFVVSDSEPPRYRYKVPAMKLPQFNTETLLHVTVTYLLILSINLFRNSQKIVAAILDNKEDFYVLLDKYPACNTIAEKKKLFKAMKKIIKTKMSCTEKILHVIVLYIASILIHAYFYEPEDELALL